MSTDTNFGYAARGSSPSLVVRAVWFLFVGWWATGLWLAVAWAAIGTVVLAPVGIKLLNYTPKVVALKPTADVATGRPREQRSLLVRAVWFLLVGWWASGLWAAAAYAVTVTVVGLPLAIWMYGKLPFVASLYRY